MNKRITSILAASILAVSMVGCSDNINKKDDTTNNVKQEQQIEKKNTNTNKDKVDTNKEKTTTKEQTEKTNSNTEKNNTTKKVQQTKKKTTTKEEDDYYDENGEYVGPKHSSMDDRKNSICDNCKHPIDDCICDFNKDDDSDEDDYYAPIASCAICGTDLYRYNAEYYDKNGNRICLSCYQKEKSKPDYYCSQCGRGEYDDDGYYTDDNGNRICFECSCANLERNEIDNEMVDEDTYNK